MRERDADPHVVVEGLAVARVHKVEALVGKVFVQLTRPSPPDLLQAHDGAPLHLGIELPENALEASRCRKIFGIAVAESIRGRQR